MIIITLRKGHERTIERAFNFFVWPIDRLEFLRNLFPSRLTFPRRVNYSLFIGIRSLLHNGVR